MTDADVGIAGKATAMSQTVSAAAIAIARTTAVTAVTLVMNLVG